MDSLVQESLLDSGEQVIRKGRGSGLEITHFIINTGRE
jgi:hypothetical protein